MSRTACLVGNSSGDTREGAFIGMPVVNIETWQMARERGDNVVDVAHDEHKIADAIVSQRKRGRRPRKDVYGDGTAGRVIADILADLGRIEIQKRIAYGRATSIFYANTDMCLLPIVPAHGGSKRIQRKKRLSAQDDTPTREVLAHVVDELAARAYVSDAVIALQPTSPARTIRHIEESAALFASDLRADSLASCIEVPHIFHPLSVMRHNSEGCLEPFLAAAQPRRRQDKPNVFARNGAAINITRTPRLAECVFGGRLMAYLMDAGNSVDVDPLEDVERAECIPRARSQRAERACAAKWP
jgi:CMP-N-acetylneuraminic acid synthetase